MYIPAPYRASSPRALVAEHPFATVISECDGELYATQTPLYFRSDRDDETVLIGHFARANPHSQILAEGQNVLAVFPGPHAYISSSWYADYPTVPTWNYVSAQAKGALSPVDDTEKQFYYHHFHLDLIE